MEDKDVRWIQRFSNYRKALIQLGKAVNIVSALSNSTSDQNDLLAEGLIQRYEYTHELAWKVMKDYEEYQGITDIMGSRDAIRVALRAGILDDDRWMDTISDRNLTSHNYDDETAKHIVNNIINVYYPLFVKFETTMTGKMV
ncbi:MAG: nucleotidyltransferase substrate binding protein [Bacteroidales bacterium]|nr:nucleotidyltransferase substrate binding protein [Bacteroidales bacterium]